MQGVFGDELDLKLHLFFFDFGIKCVSEDCNQENYFVLLQDDGDVNLYIQIRNMLVKMNFKNRFILGLLWYYYKYIYCY